MLLKLGRLVYNERCNSSRSCSFIVHASFCMGSRINQLIKMYFICSTKCKVQPTFLYDFFALLRILRTFGSTLFVEDCNLSRPYSFIVHASFIHSVCMGRRMNTLIDKLRCVSFALQSTKYNFALQKP